MSKIPSLKDTAHLLESLRNSQRANHEHTLDSHLQPSMAALRQWQAARMAQTYADFLADRRFEPACRFFVDEVQAPLDLSQLTQDLERMYEMSLKILPSHLLNPLAKAVELNMLARTLDQTLLTVLLENVEVDTPLVITPELYAKSYRQCDNYEARTEQVALVSEVGRGIERVARIPLVDVTLRLARNPAQKAGWADLQDFLERGLRVFKRMGRGSGRFLRAFTTRERQIVDQIFAEADEPFKISK